MNAILEQINTIGKSFVGFALPMLAQSSILIVILLLADFFLRRKVRAVFRYWMWMLVLIKLILPASLSSPLSVGYLFGDRLTSLHVTPINPAHPQLPSTITTPIIDLSNIPAGTHTPPAAPVTFGTEIIPAEAVPPPPVPPISLSWQGIIFLLWLAVVIVMGLLLLQRAIFVKGLVAQATEADDSMKEVLDYCCQRIRLKRKTVLRVSANATSPAVCGLFSQVVLLPQNLTASLNTGQLRAVLLHELAHIKRGDLWINLAQTILQIIYFYNPLLWIANIIIRRIREQAVDEMVLVAMGENAQQYPQTLVSVAKLAFRHPILSLRLIGVVESKSALAGRIKRILSRPIPKNAKLGIVGILAVIVIAAILLPMAKAKEDKKEVQPKMGFVATLPNGVAVELVGVFEFSEGKVQNSWKPDGTRLEDPVYIHYGREYKHKAFGFIFNTDKPAGIEECDIKGTIDRLGYTLTFDANGQITQLAKQMRQHLELVRLEQSDATEINLSVAPDWIYKTQYDGRYITGKYDPKIGFFDTYETADGVRVIFSNRYESYESQLRACLSNDGIQRLISSTRGNPGSQRYAQLSTVYSTDGTRQTSALFENLKLSDIRYFELYIRPKCERLKFKNVSLQPGHKTDVQVEGESADKQVIPATKNLQSLIDAAKPGDTVTVPKGLYTEPVEINKSLTIKGESRNECIFEVTANKPAIFVDTKGKGQIVVQDLTIKWQLATSDKGIERPFALGVKDTQAEIKNCSFIPLGNFQRSPVAVRADGLTQLNISKCRFEGFEYVICYGEGTKGKTSDCLIMNCGHQGIINYTGSTLTVERNVITGSKFHAVRCTGGTLYVKDNLLINNDNRGIYLGNRSGSGTITNNLIIGNGTGIGCFARSKYEIKNNIIADSSYAGIGMEKSCLLTIQDNIFVHNERGWIMFDRGEKGANTCDRNTFWQNKADAENFEKSANSINANPDFVDPNNGDFSLRPGPALEYKQGLTNPQIFKELWKIWKKRENRNETDVQVEGEQKKEEQERPQEQPVIRAVDNKATLASGLSIELLGVTRVPVRDQPWWKPDGSPLGEPFFDWVDTDPSEDPNRDQFAYYAVAIRLDGSPPEQLGLMKWNFTDAVYAGTTGAYVGDRSLYAKNIHAAAARFSKGVETTTLHLGIVSGEWQTLFAGSHYGIYEKGGDSVYVSTPEIGGGPGLVGPSEEGIHIGVTYNITDRDFRVVAVDKEGKVYVSSRSGSGGGKNIRRTTASFPDLTREQLQEYRFQVRPYEWVEFKDIPLRPGSEAVALAEQRKARRQEELEKWLGEGQTRQIRQQIAVLRDTYDIHEPDNSQVSGILAMQELVRIGSPAVPELVAELRRCERRLTKSLIAFTLRTIGDRQVVPALIELLGQSKYSGELGIYVKDDRLANFMLDNQYRPPDEGDRKAKAVIIGCPVMEITAALEKITGHSEGHEHFGHKATAELGPDAPHEQWQQRVQQIVQETAERWQKWWDGHKDEFISR